MGQFQRKCRRRRIGAHARGGGVKTLLIEPGSPSENGYIESYNGKPRDEWLNIEIYDALLEAKCLTEQCRRAYNAIRPHSALGHVPPAPEAWLLGNSEQEAFEGRKLALGLTQRVVPFARAGQPPSFRKLRNSLRSSVVFFVFLDFFVRYGIAAALGMGLLVVGPQGEHRAEVCGEQEEWSVQEQRNREVFGAAGDDTM